MTRNETVGNQVFSHVSVHPNKCLRFTHILFEPSFRPEHMSIAPPNIRVSEWYECQVVPLVSWCGTSHMLYPNVETWTNVPFGTWSSWYVSPEAPTIGVDKGRTLSSEA